MTEIVRKTSNTNFAIALLVVSSILWGGSFVSAKIGLEYVNAYDFAFLRMAIASAILVSALGLRGGMKASVLKETSFWMLGLLNGVAFALQYVGLVFTSAGKAALLVNLNIVMVALLSWRVFRERFGLSKMFGVGLGVTGGALIATNGNLSTLFQGEMFGDLLVFSASLVWAFFIVLNKWVLTRVEADSIQISAVVMLATAVVLLPFAVVFGGLNVGAVSGVGWAWVAFTAIVCTALPYGLWILALKAVTATMASLVAMLEIVAAMILSGILLGETYSTATVVGAAMVLASILAVVQS
jgi:drug/metabolite transporter (DMT)-like permease